jgi:hypothetical protein
MESPAVSTQAGPRYLYCFGEGGSASASVVTAVVALEDVYTTLMPSCSKRFVRYVETNWMVLVLLSESTASAMKLHPTDRSLLLHPSQAQVAPYSGSLLRLEMEIA